MILYAQSRVFTTILLVTALNSENVTLETVINNVSAVSREECGCIQVFSMEQDKGVFSLIVSFLYDWYLLSSFPWAEQV